MDLFRTLGFYDFTGSRYSLNIYDIPERYLNVEQHEQIHATLAMHSTLGFLSILLHERRPQSNELFGTNKLVLNELINRTREVHEGTATYIEYHSLNKEERTVFLENLRALPQTYQRGFQTARLIDEILSDDRLRNIPKANDRKYIRRCALIDISRFALNVPVISFLKDFKGKDLFLAIKNCLSENDPTDRWQHVLKTLYQEKRLADRFVKQCLPMFQLWVEKVRGPQSVDGVYAGVLLSDNIEPVLAKLYPKIYWKPHVQELVSLPGVSEISGKDSYESFLLRSIAADLLFSPRLPIQLLPSNALESLLKLIKSCQPGGGWGCYIKIIINMSEQTRELNWGSDFGQFKLSTGQSLVLVHPAIFKFQPDGRRVWAYKSSISALYVATSNLKSIVDSIESDDCVLTIEIDSATESAFDLIFDKIQRPGVPLFIFPSPAGSFSTFLDTCNSETFESIPIDVFPLSNQSDFSGVENQDIWTIWMVPQFENRDVFIIIFGTPVLHRAIIDYLQSGEAKNKNVHLSLKRNELIFDLRSASFPLNTAIADNLTILSIPLLINDDHDEHLVHGPNNGYVAVAHMLSFGI